MFDKSITDGNVGAKRDREGKLEDVGILGEKNKWHKEEGEVAEFIEGRHKEHHEY
jgi:hypothetical protein